MPISIRGYICADNPEQVIKSRLMSRICQGYLRSPTCEKLLRVHVRDLEVVNYTSAFEMRTQLCSPS